MISKKITLSTLMIATIGCNNYVTALSDKAYAECYQGTDDSQYRYLEFYFVEQPKNLLNEQMKQARAIALAAITSIVIFNSYSPFFDPKIDITTISAALLGMTGFDWYSSKQETKIKHDLLVKFIKNLDFHIHYIPISFIPTFEELATTYNASKTKTFTPEEVNAIFELIQHLIEHEFAKRYEKEKKKDSDTLSIVKTFTDVYKNLK